MLIVSSSVVTEVGEFAVVDDRDHDVELLGVSNQQGLFAVERSARIYLVNG